MWLRTVVLMTLCMGCDDGAGDSDADTSGTDTETATDSDTETETETETGEDWVEIRSVRDDQSDCRQTVDVVGQRITSGLAVDACPQCDAIYTITPLTDRACDENISYPTIGVVIRDRGQASFLYLTQVGNSDEWYTETLTDGTWRVGAEGRTKLAFEWTGWNGLRYVSDVQARVP